MDLNGSGRNPAYAVLSGEEASARKKILRREARACLLQMTESEAAASGRIIAAAVLSSPLWQNASSLFIYVSIGREPDTALLISRALQEGKRVYVPKCAAPPRMSAVRILSPDELVPGRLGIPEPAEIRETAEHIDLAVVPCLSASPDGRRLGHGGGYYDAFLRGRDFPAVCLCHRELIRRDIPVTALDVLMDAVIFPGKDAGIPLDIPEGT